jgi:hypothetical protein
MEARLRQLGVVRIVTGEYKEPEEPDYVTPTPAGGTAAAPVAAVALTRDERALNTQLKVAYERELNEFKDRQEKAAGDILAHLSRSQRTHVAARRSPSLPPAQVSASLARPDAHWIADTGATFHVSPRRSWFTKLEPLAIPICHA